MNLKARFCFCTVFLCVLSKHCPLTLLFSQVRLTKHVEKLLMFMEVQRELEVWLEEMSETISRLSPVSEDGEKAKAQLTNTKVGKRF